MKREPSTTQKHGINLANRLSLSFIGLAALVLIIGLVIAYLNFRTQFRAQLKQRLLDIVSVAALQQNGDLFLSVHAENDPAFETIRQQNLKIRASDSDLRFVYTMCFDNNGVYFVVDATNPGEPGTSFYGERYYEPGPVLANNYRTIDRPLVENNFYTDEYGTFLSAYAPFYSSDGKFAGIIAADISAAKVLSQERQVLLQFVIMFLLVLPVMGYVGWLLGNRLAKPIESITSAAKRLSEGDLSYRPIIKTSFPEVRVLRDTFYSMSDQLLSLIKDMEQRITERTSVLEKRSLELQNAAQIVREVSTIQDVDMLLNRVTYLIKERFGYYHTGIFLIDDNEEYAVLKSASSEAGQLLLASNHKLKIEETSIVGYVAKKGEPRIALDVGTDAVHFQNPLLPYTRSEMALPLKIANRIIGVLDIQSDKTNAFDQSNIAVIQIVTDQVDIGIERSQFLRGMQQSAAELELTLQQNTSRTWRNFLVKKSGSIGYRYDGVTTEVLSRLPEDILNVMDKDKPEILAKDEFGRTGNALAVPIRLRGLTLGTIILQFQVNEIPQETSNLAQEAANRLALALENARLAAEAQQRAEQERIIGQVTAKMRQTLDIETILKTAVKEIRQTFELREAEVRMQLSEDIKSIEVSNE